jgi:aldose 1-epimerase
MQHSPDRPAYATAREGDIIRLIDRAHEMSVDVVPTIGHIATSLRVRGHEVLYSPFASLEAFRAAPRLCGIPFLAPFANRLDERAFYANGRRYALDMDLGNIRELAPGVPIHGFVSTTSHWQVVDLAADAGGAWVTSRLEFFRRPEWIKQFPFAHTIDMTYRLADGALEVATTIDNASAEPMPVSIGYHPYFQLTDAPRPEWTLSIAARTHWRLSDAKIPTGETEPITALFADPAAVPLASANLDDVFTDLERDDEGRATMTLVGRAQKLDVVFGPNYRAAVIWSPPTGPDGGPATFMCIEPMAAITDAMNLAHRQQYHDLQTIPPGGRWHERFWIRPRGFERVS